MVALHLAFFCKYLYFILTQFKDIYQLKNSEFLRRDNTHPHFVYFICIL